MGPKKPKYERLTPLRHPALLIFLGLLGVCWSASLVGTTGDQEACLYEDEIWGGEDIRKFYFCISGEVYEDTCDTDYYFVRNATYSGCLPAALMNPQCVNLDAVEPDCEGISAEQPQPTDLLNQYYLCTDDGVKQLSCGEDKAFINQDGYLGCFPWTQWRTLRNCSEG
ncbi:GL27267 [Drosophila persimilis]|uniref:GL27267 n=1 Tax=Drosophila persimilis TaxID=7234 RepID=B4GYX2_DROPE|nr:uncharacterized protein LOC6598753 [Drosophila persimilis]EDW27990.1 GL27267 [Drosophila persimilis]